MLPKKVAQAQKMQQKYEDDLFQSPGNHRQNALLLLRVGDRALWRLGNTLNGGAEVGGQRLLLIRERVLELGLRGAKVFWYDPEEGV